MPPRSENVEESPQERPKSSQDHLKYPFDPLNSPCRSAPASCDNLNQYPEYCHHRHSRNCTKKCSEPMPFAIVLITAATLKSRIQLALAPSDFK